MNVQPKESQITLAIEMRKEFLILKVFPEETFKDQDFWLLREGSLDFIDFFALKSMI